VNLKTYFTTKRTKVTKSFYRIAGDASKGKFNAPLFSFVFFVV
jgi:hypothetical protein